MNWRDIITNFDKSTAEYAHSDRYAMMDALDIFGNIGDVHSYDTRINKYRVYTWLCPDTWVGIAVYVMDDEIVAVSFQPFRKSEERIEFLSLESAAKMRTFIMSLFVCDPVIVNLDTDFDQSLSKLAKKAISANIS